MSKYSGKINIENPLLINILMCFINNFHSFLFYFQMPKDPKYNFGVLSLLKSPFQEIICIKESFISLLDTLVNTLNDLRMQILFH